MILRLPYNPRGYQLTASVLAMAGGLQAVYNFPEDLPTDLSVAMNNLAWVLATHPQVKYRNGAEAVRYAKEAAAVAAEPRPELLDTLAAAQAEAGQFAEAAVTARQAIDLATARVQPDTADRIRHRLALYKAHRPDHEPAAKP